MSNPCLNSHMARMWIDYILDAGHTPYIVVCPDDTERQIDVPMEHVKEDTGAIILNVTPAAIRGFSINNETGYMSFSARFSGVAHNIFIPCETIRYVYARETGLQGTLPDDLTYYYHDSVADLRDGLASAADKVGSKKENTKSSGKRPSLTIVK